MMYYKVTFNSSTDFTFATRVFLYTIFTATAREYLANVDFTRPPLQPSRL